MTYQDYERIISMFPTVVGATPLREFRQNVRHLESEIEARIVGVNPDFIRLTGQHIEGGRFLTDTDGFYASNVAVLGADAARKLFPFGDPIGQSIRIGEKNYYRIVGVTSYKAPSAGVGISLAAQNFNRDVYIPLTTDRGTVRRAPDQRKTGEFHRREDRAVADHRHGGCHGERQADLPGD